MSVGVGRRWWMFVLQLGVMLLMLMLMMLILLQRRGNGRGWRRCDPQTWIQRVLLLLRRHRNGTSRLVFIVGVVGLFAVAVRCTAKIEADGGMAGEGGRSFCQDDYSTLRRLVRLQCSFHLL